VADTGAATEGSGPVEFDVLANDSDPDGDALTLTNAEVTDGLGTVSIVDGKVVFNPDASHNSLAEGETATVTVTYTIEDTFGETSTADLTITVTGTNDGPIAVADTGAVTEGSGATSFDVLANDSDPDGDALTLTNAEVTDGLGTVSIVDGKVVFNPDASHNDLAEGETATVTVTYTIEDAFGETSTADLTITVTGTNDGPIAVADTGAVIEGAGPVEFDVLANDSDPDGDALTLTNAEVTNGLGSVSIVDGKVVFNPDASHNSLAEGETATVTVTYTIEDAFGETATADLTITVTGTNDAPSFTLDGTNVAENAVGGTVVGDLAVLDPDHNDTHTYTITNNDSPFTIVNNQLVVKDGAVLDYETLNAIPVEIQVTDNHGASQTQQFTIDLSNQNDVPTATADLGAAVEGAGAVAFDVLANDSDLENDALTLSEAHVESGAGSVSIVAGKIVFNPDASHNYLAEGETTEVVVRYTVEDASGGSAIGELTINVTGTNDGPTDIGLSHSHILESSSGGTVVGNLSTIDPDFIDTHSYQILPEYETASLVDALTDNPNATYSVAYNGSDTAPLALSAAGTLENGLGLDTHTVWRIRNTTDQDQTVNLKDNGGGTGATVTYTVPAHSDLFVADGIHVSIGLGGIVLLGTNSHTLMQNGSTIETKSPNYNDFTTTTSVVTGVVDSPFEIQNGQLVIKDGANFDYDTASSYDVDIQSTDPHGASTTKTFTINVIDDGGAQGQDLISLDLDIFGLNNDDSENNGSLIDIDLNLLAGDDLLGADVGLLEGGDAPDDLLDLDLLDDDSGDNGGSLIDIDANDSDSSWLEATDDENAAAEDQEPVDWIEATSTDSGGDAVEPDNGDLPDDDLLYMNEDPEVNADNPFA
jgi:VCBS repeat-containing protein